MEPFASARVTIVNERGLHARAAAKFVKVAGSYDAEVTVLANGVEVPGSSIMALMMLAAAPGCEVELRARGPGAHDAIEALVSLIENRFDED
ncbi:MAG: HPr family phosphocarrier protein [Alphaproteobacteria bacterium]|nr:MAG: HPr family phosphocarrier protein [Alphaproteobacteria bacterium]